MAVGCFLTTGRHLFINISRLLLHMIGEKKHEESFYHSYRPEGFG